MSANIDQATLEKLAHLFGLILYKPNLQTKEISMNLNTTRVTGHNYDDLPRSENSKEGMIYPDDLDLVNNSIYSIISGQKDYYHIEYRMRRRDSSIVWIEEVGLISGYDAQGRPLYMSAMAADMSRLKWAEEKARKIEAEAARIASTRGDAELREENRLLQTSNSAAAMIIGGFHQEYETVLHQAVQMLGEGLQANYACFWRNAINDGQTRCFVRTHWTTKARTLGDESGTVFFKYDDFLPGWKEKLAPGKFLSLNGDGLGKEFKEACDMHNAKSILLIPLYLHEDLS